MKKRFLAIVTILLMLFTFIAPAINAFADDETNPILITGNDNDKNTKLKSIIGADWDNSYKFPDDFKDGKFEDGTYTSKDGKFQVKLSFSDPDKGVPRQVSWTPGPENQVEISYVFVKAADGGYLYSYDGSGDIYDDLHGLVGHALSHFTFFYKSVTPPPKTYNIKVLKVDNSDSNKKLSGAEFTLTKDGDAVFSKTGTTGTDGYATFSDLSAGTYHISETKAPSGYDLSKEIKDVTLPSDGGDAEIVFKDTQTSPKTYSINILKVEKGNSDNKLSGATFKLTSQSSGDFQAQTAITDVNGAASFSDLLEGNYTITETGAPEGYKLCPSQTVSLPGDNNKTYTFEDEHETPKTYSINILKIEKGNSSKKLSGATFKLTKQDDTSFAEKIATTNDNGAASFSGLPEGNYTITETGAPKGYQLCPSQTVSLPGDSNKTYTFEDEHETPPPPTIYSIKVLKIDKSDSSKKLSGAEFILTKEGDLAFSKTGITLADGYAVFSDLEAGTYHLKETKAPSGYGLSTEIKDVTLPNNGGNAEITFEDTQTPPPPPPTTYSIKVLKVDKSDDTKKLSGAEFILTKEGDSAFSKTGITLADGYAVFSDLEAGTYHVKETKAPEGYDLSIEIKDVTLPNDGGNAEITFEDTQTPPPPPPTTYSIKVLKVDKSNGSIIKTGAEFTLTKDGDTTFSKIGITGADGYAVFSDLEAGTYHLKETKAPSGYGLSTEIKDVTLPNDGGNAEITFEDVHETPPPPPPPMTYSIKVLKVDNNDSSKKLSGAEFTLTKDGDIAFSKTGTTGIDGYATFINLEAGTYHLRETKAPEGYVLSTETKNVTLPSNDGDAEITFEDVHETPPPPPPPMTYSIKAVKVDDSDSSKLLQGAEFTIIKQNSTSFKQTGITGSDGTVTFNNLLAGTYYVEETKAPAGYEISKKIETIVLPSGNGDAVVTFNDKKQITEKYSIKIFKVDTSDKNKKLVGAEFTLTKKDDPLFKQTGITGADGSVVFDNLTAGTYNVQETKAPDGYEISTLTQTVTLPSEDKNAEITFYDDPSKVIPEEPVPGTEPEIPIIDEPVPGAEPVLPKTGELPPELFYGLGAAFVLAGIFMKKHK